MVWRFIPALAGNIGRRASGVGRRASGVGCRPVHPRARGEHRDDQIFCHDFFGSSPRSRGTFEEDCSERPIHRFIPALAGNIKFEIIRPLIDTVHPRARGEHANISVEDVKRHGSSPRSRGTSGVRWCYFGFVRFIPALAGNIFSHPGLHSIFAVHPRARGEHNDSVDNEDIIVGSSPRSRGTYHENHRTRY